MGTKVLAVRVGPEGQHTDFTVHEQLICASSEFFKAAMGREWRESEERLVRLLSCQAKAFQIYVQWLYSGRLYASQCGGPELKIEAEKCNFMQGYLLGDYLQDINYKDTLLDALREWVQTLSYVRL
jgi:hypothetical protein